jgi:hypothetical protein
MQELLGLVMYRKKLMTSAAGAVFALALSAGNAAAQEAQQNVLQPFHGDISPFYGDISPFHGDISPFWGDISPFWGDISPFHGDISPFWGDISPFHGDISPFYGDIAPFWGDISPFMEELRSHWGDISPFEEGSSDYDALQGDFEALISRSEAFWGAAVQGQTGQSFRDGFAAELFERYGIDLEDASTLDGFSEVDRARFMFDWYDGLMAFSGRDHVDHWMRTANWSPALAQSAGAGQGVVIGLFDFTPAGAGVEMMDWRYEGYGNVGAGHGAAVASLLAADHDGMGIMGIAPNAVIAGYNPFDASGTTNWDDIATGLYRLRQSGASVVNLSLGLPGATFAPDWAGLYADPLVRSSLRDTVFVHAAGNEGVAQTQNIDWNFSTNASIIVVGSVGPSGVISPFSNTPGTACLMNNGVCQERLMNRFIVAPGEWILTSDGQGGVMRQSGTSFAAPLVSGAVALLQGRWGWLKNYPYETAEVLFRTARDLGAPGVDPVYGRGMLDIAASQAPVSMANLYQRTTSGERVALTTSGTGGSLLGAVDGYVTVYEDIGATYRDFRIPVSTNLSTVNSTPTTSLLSTTSTRTTRTSRRSEFADDFTAQVANPFGWDMQMTLSPLPAGEFMRDGEMPYAFDLMLADGDGLALYAGRGYGALALAGQFGFDASSYATDVGGANPILGLASGGGYIAAELPLGGGFSFSAGFTERQSQTFEADVFTGEERPLFEEFAPYKSAAAHVLLRQSISEGFSISAAYTYLREDDGLLGLQSVNPEDFAAGTETDAATFGLDWAPNARFNMALSATFGRTRSNGGQSLAIGEDGVAVSAFEAAFDFTGVFGRNDVARLRIAQPLHVDGGSLDVTSIDVVDRETGELGAVTQSVQLGGGERQYLVEGAYAAPLFDGQGEISAFARIDASEDGAEPVEQMVGARFSLNF